MYDIEPCQEVLFDLLISYATERLRTICLNELEGIEFLGTTIAATLRCRLADLDAAETISDLIAGKPEIQADGTLVVQLTPVIFLRMVPNHTQQRLNTDGSPRWEKVTRLRILQIGSTNADES